MHKTENLTGVMLKSLIPAQILSVALVNANAFLDSVITGALLGSEAIAAISFVQPVTMLISMLGGALAAGAQVLCGRYVGRGDGEGANRVLTVTAFWSVLMGVLLMLPCLLCSQQISALMGAEGDDLVRCADYLRGLSWGIIFTLFSTSLMTFMQLDNASNMAMAATVSLLAVNVGFDVINIAVLGQGMFGLGLATTYSYAAMLLVGVIYYVSKKCNFRIKPKLVSMRESGQIFYFGLSGAFAPLALGLRALFLNNVCFRLAGTIGVSAVGIFYTMSGFVSALAGGVGGAAGILSSVFVGERNRSSLQELVPMAIKKGMLLHLAAYAVVFVTAKPLAIAFGTVGADIPFVVHAIRCSMTCLLVNYFAAVSFSICKSLGYTWLVSICSVLDYLVFQLVFVLAFSGVLGIDAVWFGSIFSELGVLLVMVLFYRRKSGKFPESVFDYIFIPESVSAKEEDCFDMSMRTVDEVENVSKQVIALCESKGMDSRRSYFCGLCIEEQCVNIIQHGFTKGGDPEKFSIDLRMIYEDGRVIISLRDNCRKFDPTCWRRKESEADPLKGIGIKMVQELASSVSYHHTLGLNVLSIEI